MRDTHEDYVVTLDYQKEDGYWVVSHRVEITVRLDSGMKEKCNHKKAEKVAKKFFPGCVIKRVDYV